LSGNVALDAAFGDDARFGDGAGRVEGRVVGSADAAVGVGEALGASAYALAATVGVALGPTASVGGGAVAAPDINLTTAPRSSAAMMVPAARSTMVRNAGGRFE
jgi:hypothetical protein